MGLHGVVGVHVVVAHKPARGVGANRQGGKAQRAEALVDQFEFRPQATVTGKQHRPFGRVEHKAQPQAAVGVVAGACRPVLHGHGMQAELLVQRQALPPVQLDDIGEAALANQPAIAQTCDHLGQREALGQLAQAEQVEVVVVVVADQNQVNRRQLVEAQAGRVITLRADKFERAGAFAPQRVGEDVQAVLLDQQGGVIDVGDVQFGAVHPADDLGRHLWAGLRHPLHLRRAAEPPLEHIAQAFMGLGFEVVKTFAIEMVAAGPAVGTAMAAQQVEQGQPPGGAQNTEHADSLLRLRCAST